MFKIVNLIRNTNSRLASEIAEEWFKDLSTRRSPDVRRFLQGLIAPTPAGEVSFAYQLANDILQNVDDHLAFYGLVGMSSGNLTFQLRDKLEALAPEWLKQWEEKEAEYLCDFQCVNLVAHLLHDCTKGED